MVDNLLVQLGELEVEEDHLHGKAHGVVGFDHQLLLHAHRSTAELEATLDALSLWIRRGKAHDCRMHLEAVVCLVSHLPVAAGRDEPGARSVAMWY